MSMGRTNKSWCSLCPSSFWPSFLLSLIRDRGLCGLMLPVTCAVLGPILAPTLKLDLCVREGPPAPHPVPSRAS